MTCEKALKAMKYLFLSGKWNCEYNSREVSKVVFDALEKQIEKMPTVSQNNCFYCPSCSRKLPCAYEHHCKCGQALKHLEVHG